MTQGVGSNPQTLFAGHGVKEQKTKRIHTEVTVVNGVVSGRAVVPRGLTP